MVQCAPPNKLIHELYRRFIVDEPTSSFLGPGAPDMCKNIAQKLSKIIITFKHTAQYYDAEIKPAVLIPTDGTCDEPKHGVFSTETQLQGILHLIVIDKIVGVTTSSLFYRGAAVPHSMRPAPPALIPPCPPTLSYPHITLDNSEVVRRPYICKNKQVTFEFDYYQSIVL